MKIAVAVTAFLVTMVVVTLPGNSISQGAQASPPAPAPAPAPEPDDLSGLYACNGLTADGGEYRGTVEIVRHEGTYQLLWMLPPREQHLGIGIVGIDHKNLAVSYFGDVPGVVIYRIERSERAMRLIGEWTVVSADGEVFSEQLVRVGPNSGRLHFKVVPRPAGTSGASPRRPA
jgi:hypothetical protein